MRFFLNSYSRALVLAMIDGVFVGLIMEALYKVYDAWEWKRADEYAQHLGVQIHVDRIGSPFHNPLVIPALFVVAFSMSALLLRWLFRNRPISLIVLWELTAAVGVTIALTIYFFRELRVDVLFIAQPNARYDLFGRFLTWVACILIAGIVNLIYGTILQLFREGPFSYLGAPR